MFLQSLASICAYRKLLFRERSREDFSLLIELIEKYPYFIKIMSHDTLLVMCQVVSFFFISLILFKAANENARWTRP